MKTKQRQYMKRKLDEYTAEARPLKRFKVNPTDFVEGCLKEHFHVREDSSNHDKIEEESEKLPALDQTLLFGSEKEFRDAISSMQDLNQMIGEEDDYEDQETLLMIAISRGFTEIAKELLPKVDLWIQTSAYQHALHYACEYDIDEVAFAILDIMKDDKDYLNTLDLDLMTPLFYAAQNGNKNICKRLLSLKAKEQFFASEYDCPEEHQNNTAFCARYFAADSLDVETFKLFVNQDVIREYGGDLKNEFEDKNDFIKFMMACTLVEPFLVQYMNDLNGYKPYTINVAHVTMDGLKGDESAEPSVDEGGQLESASQSFELVDLCKKFFPDNLEYQYYIWKYAIGTGPTPIHAIIMGDLDMLKHLMQEHTNEFDNLWPDYDSGPVVAQSVISLATSNNDIELLKYVCEDMDLIKLLGEEHTFEIPPDVTGPILKYLKSLGGVSLELNEDRIQVLEYFATEDQSLALLDFRVGDMTGEQEISTETLNLVDSEQEGPITLLRDEILIEILSNINVSVFDKNQNDNISVIFEKVCKKFQHVLQLPEFWRRYWTKRVEFAVMDLDWTKIVDFVFVRSDTNLNFRQNIQEKGLKVVKLANITAIKGTYCYEIINTKTGKKKLIERDFSVDPVPFVYCTEDETINFGDVSPITSPKGYPALYNGQKVKQFIPSGKITLKTIHIKEVADDWSEEALIKNSMYG